VARHVLATLVRVLSDDARVASVFHRLPGAPDAVNSVAYADFFRLLATDDWFSQEKALFCLAKVIEHRPKKDMGLAAVAAACGGGPGGSVEGAAASAAEPMGAAAQTVVQLTQWLCAQLARPSHASRALPAVVSALAVLLAVREARALVTHSGGVRLLGDATTRLAPDPRDPEPAPHDVQALYESTLCLWFLTFHPPATREMARSGVVIPALMDVARTAAKEKVARVAVLALSEIVAAASGGRRGRVDADAPSPRGDAGGDAGDAEDENGSSVVPLVGMDEVALGKVVASLKLRGFADEELGAALGDLETGAAARLREATSWSRYRAELLSGHPSWTPSHTDDAFWRENAQKLTDDNCQLLRVLVNILAEDEASGAIATAVALHDVGEFATRYPAGRFLVADVGGKEHAMRLLTHADDEVRKHALLCTQKLLVANWQFLGDEQKGR